jgi:hypothetical protein
MRIKALIASLLCACLMLCSCDPAKADTVAARASRYLGDVDYSSTVSALVYEEIPGEEDGGKGIVYRVVSDVYGLTHQTDIAVCLYFYDYMATGEVVNITAGVEDLSQALSDRVLFVAVDGIAESDLGSTYGVEAYPEFVLLAPGQPNAKFEGINYDNWSIEDVAAWLSQHGYTPDYSKLEG